MTNYNYQVVANVVMVPIDHLSTAKFNPELRHEPSSLKKLMATIKVYGLKKYHPIVAHKNGMIVSGHGRYLSAKELGLKEVPVIFLDDDEDAETAFTISNIVRNWTGKHWSWVAAKGFISLLPDMQLKNYEYIMSYADETLINLICDKKQSLNIANAAQKALVFIDRVGDRAYTRKVLFWVVNHDQQNAINQRNKRNYKPVDFINAIENDIPLP